MTDTVCTNPSGSGPKSKHLSRKRLSKSNRNVPALKESAGKTTGFKFKDFGEGKFVVCFKTRHIPRWTFHKVK
ncbi:MAG: hypothetical protein AMJ45_05510 [Syntrophobacter sp. DG_60]|nr:MAG: hypothetical protein AMJ45_05510 [Syntrophobacter sp. DG_60]